MSGPGYDPRSSGRSRRAGQKINALLGLDPRGMAGSIQPSGLSSGDEGQFLYAGPTTIVVEFTTPGLTVWNSPFTGNVLVECVGPGGDATANGGGGGQYASDTVAVVAGTDYSIFVGDPRSGFASSSFNATVVKANGGGNATAGSGGAGGTGGAGTNLKDGGAGSKPAGAVDDIGGGGGGSSATATSVGTVGSISIDGTGAAGGVGPGGEGSGGAGGTSSDGYDGVFPGGGGGGCSAASVNGGRGAKGRVRLTYIEAGAVTQWVTLSGEASMVSDAIVLSNAAVIAKVLTGYVSGAGVVAATDSILQAIQKLSGNIAAIPSSVLSIFDHYADVGNVGTGVDDLYSDTIAAGRLAANGDKLEAAYCLAVADSATATRQVVVNFAGQKIFDSGPLTFGSKGAANIYVTIIRVSSSVVRCAVEFAATGLTLQPISVYTEITGLTLANTQILKITGEAAGVGAATDDIVAKMGYVNFVPHA